MHFFENYKQKTAVYFGARLPSKLVYIGAKGVFRKKFGVRHQTWLSQNRTKGDPLVRQGIESLVGGGGRMQPLLPKSAPAFELSLKKVK